MDEGKEVTACGPTASRDIAAHKVEEIDFLGYVLVVWRYKYLIAAASILVALIAGAIVCGIPRVYSATYVYRDWNFAEGEYEAFLNRLHSSENLEHIAKNLCESTGGVSLSLAARLKNEPEYVLKLVEFRVWPAYPDPVEVRGKEAIGPSVSELVFMTVKAHSRADVRRVAAVLRESVENLAPLLKAEHESRILVKKYNTLASEIEAGRYPLGLSLEEARAVLARLRKITPAAGVSEGGIGLQFDIGDKSEYLPLSYHIRAMETRAAELEEKMSGNEKKHAYYVDLAAFHRECIGELAHADVGAYTLEAYFAFIDERQRNSEKQEIQDYLSSYKKTVMNSTLSGRPVSESPRIEAVSKGLVRKTDVAFGIALVASVFAAFMIEGVRRQRLAVSAEHA